jgi:membrane-associated protein
VPIRELLTAGILDPQSLIAGAGPWALAAVSLVVFAETGLLVGFFLPGDTLLFFTGIVVLTGALHYPLWLVIGCVTVAAVLGDQLGYLIGRAAGPPVFDRKESGVFSRASVARTTSFFERFGSAAVILARFVPVVRTFTPVMAGVGRMRYRRFIAFNIIGAAAWCTALVVLGFGLGHVPGVADFVARYIDAILVGIVIVSVLPVVVRAISVRRRNRVDEHTDKPS